MWEMGCTTYSGEEDAKVVGPWLRKVERVYRSYASARGSTSRLCDPSIDLDCPLLVGDYRRKENRREVEVERFSRGI
jgi:hypothetical protein